MNGDRPLPGSAPHPTAAHWRVIPLDGNAEAIVLLEQLYWDTLDAIAVREGMTTAHLVRETDRRRVLLSNAMALEPALRTLCVSYYRQAAELSDDPSPADLGQLMSKAMNFRR